MYYKQNLSIIINNNYINYIILFDKKIIIMKSNNIWIIFYINKGNNEIKRLILSYNNKK